MNQLTPISTAPQPTGFALVPRDMREAMDLATMMSKGKLVPAALQQSPADCLLVIEQATRWGMSPFAVAQEVSVIQGRLMHSGKIVAAAVHGSGVLQGRLTYTYTGENGALAVIVRGLLRGDAEPSEVTVRLADAKTTNQHWVKSPQQMLAYHGARVWARRFVPEVMLGVYSPEEFDAPQEPRQVENLAEPPITRPTRTPNTLSQEVAAAQVTLPVLAPSGALHRLAPNRWLVAISRALGGLEDVAAMRTWSEAMVEHLAAAREHDDALAHQAEMLIAGRMLELAGPPDAEPDEPGAVEPDEA